MTDQQKSTFYSYPARGFGIITIFLFFAPIVQTIAGSYLYHNWVGGNNLLTEIIDVLTNEAWPRILPGYSYYMPSVFLSGIACSIPPSRGEGLSLSGAIWRTILVSLMVELCYIVLISSYASHVDSDEITRAIVFGMVQWIFSAWVCWIVATGFRLDLPAGAQPNK